MPSGEVRCRPLDDADKIVERGCAVLVIGDAEEQGRQDLAQGSEVVILGVAEDGGNFCGCVGKEGRNFLGRHCCSWHLKCTWFGHGRDGKLGYVLAACAECQEIVAVTQVN